MKDYHCCATCQHFKAERWPDRMVYSCSRLAYETKPSYQFKCWNPKQSIKKLMEREQQN